MSAHSDPPLAESSFRVGQVSQPYALACVALTIVGFIATALLVHRALPPMNPEGIGVKLRYFAAHKDEFDTLIVGTSHVNYSLDPAMFDAEMRREGMPTRTFNFGMYSMHPPENFFVIDQILKTKPTKLKRVVLELEGIVSTAAAENKSARRTRYWHDPKRTSLALHKAIDPQGRSGMIGRVYYLVRDRRDIALDLALFVQELVSLGRGADFISGASADDAKTFAVELGTNSDGFRPPHEAMSADAARNYEGKLARECGTFDTNPIDPYSESAFREIAQRIRELGAQPIFVVTPVLSQTAPEFRGPPPGPVLVFNDCRRYPQLYAPSARADENHLSKEGAQEFTRLFAHELVRATNEK